MLFFLLAALAKLDAAASQARQQRRVLEQAAGTSGAEDQRLRQSLEQRQVAVSPTVALGSAPPN